VYFICPDVASILNTTPVLSPIYLLFNTQPGVGDPAGDFWIPCRVKYANLLFASPVVSIVTETWAVNALTDVSNIKSVTSAGEL